MSFRNAFDRLFDSSLYEPGLHINMPAQPGQQGLCQEGFFFLIVRKWGCLGVFCFHLLSKRKRFEWVQDLDPGSDATKESLVRPVKIGGRKLKLSLIMKDFSLVEQSQELIQADSIAGGNAIRIAASQRGA